MTTKMTARVSPEAIMLEIANKARWVAGKALSGGPVPGIEGFNFGLIPEEFREVVRDATYAVYSYETPIVGEVDGRWLVPDAYYGNTTSRQTGMVTRALDALGITWEKISSVTGETVRVR